MSARNLSHAEEWALMTDLEKRSAAAGYATTLLKGVRAGKYAERPVEATEVIVLAQWLLNGHLLPPPYQWGDDGELDNVVTFPGVDL